MPAYVKRLEEGREITDGCHPPGAEVVPRGYTACLFSAAASVYYETSPQISLHWEGFPPHPQSKRLELCNVLPTPHAPLSNG